MLSSDNPLKVIAIYIVRIGQWGFELPCFSCHFNVSHQNRIVLKTLTFIRQPLILNRCLQNTLRSDYLIKRFDSLQISHRGRFGVLSPKFHFSSYCYPLGLKLCYWSLPSNWPCGLKCLHLIEINGTKYLSTPHIFVKMHHFWCHWLFYGKHMH